MAPLSPRHELKGANLEMATPDFAVWLWTWRKQDGVIP